uniref:Secreted protein n=1 Tax=Setaria viridis TaxID=4556 RepID=A0A4U6TXM4_SETVI|nr:hypothetical protein SEVIR_7G237066v2 [Setaria viridis]
MSCHIQCCLFFFGFMPFFIRTASSSRLEASRTFRLPLWCSSDGESTFDRNHHVTAQLEDGIHL